MKYQNLFVYGTLMSRYLEPRDGKIKRHPRSDILRGFRFERSVLNDYKLLWPDGLDYPFIINVEGYSVEGEIYYAVGEDTIRALDEIEGIAVGLFEKKIVKLITDSGNKIKALTYIGGESLQRYKNSSSYITVIPEKFEK